MCANSKDRMPPQIGEILSEAVYDGKLKSNPKHPITEKVTACHFFNIVNGREKQPDGKSFMVTLIFLILDTILL